MNLNPAPRPEYTVPPSISQKFYFRQHTGFPTSVGTNKCAYQYIGPPGHGQWEISKMYTARLPKPDPQFGHFSLTLLICVCARRRQARAHGGAQLLRPFGCPPRTACMRRAQVRACACCTQFRSAPPGGVAGLRTHLGQPRGPAGRYKARARAHTHRHTHTGDTGLFIKIVSIN